MNKWHVLSQAMLEENQTGDVFLAERISPQQLQNAYQENRAVITERDGIILGFGALWETEDSGWLEVGSLFVIPEARGARLSSELYPRRLALVPSGIRCFVVTHRAEAVHLALLHGFTEATPDDWFDLAPYHLVCGPCDRITGDKSHCPYRADPKECRLLVR